MKKRIPLLIWSLAASVILSLGLAAQEQVDVSVKVTKNGKVVQDTTYQFDDASEAKHAMKMMEVLSGSDEYMEQMNYHTAHAGAKHSKAMVYISEDGEKTKIKEFHGDSLVWVSEGEHPHGEHVIIMKRGDGNTIDILVDEDCEDKNIIKKKEVRVVVEGDEEGSWTVVDVDEEDSDIEEEVYILKGDDNIKHEIMKIMEEHDGEEDAKVKVIVIKESGDVDADQDEDSDHDEDVEVKVVKKKKKK